MGGLLYLIAFVLIVAWLIGFIGFGDAVGSFIHILLVAAVIILAVKLFGSL